MWSAVTTQTQCRALKHPNHLKSHLDPFISNCDRLPHGLPKQIIYCNPSKKLTISHKIQKKHLLLLFFSILDFSPWRYTLEENAGLSCLKDIYSSSPDTFLPPPSILALGRFFHITPFIFNSRLPTNSWINITDLYVVPLRTTSTHEKEFWNSI